MLGLANLDVSGQISHRLWSYDVDRIASRLAEICEIEINDIFLKGKQQNRLKARSLSCYWALRELGMSLTELARRLGISVAGVGYSVERGEIIARENQFRLIESVYENFKGAPLHGLFPPRHRIRKGSVTF